MIHGDTSQLMIMAEKASLPEADQCTKHNALLMLHMKRNLNTLIYTAQNVAKFTSQQGWQAENTQTVLQLTAMKEECLPLPRHILHTTAWSYHAKIRY